MVAQVRAKTLARVPDQALLNEVVDVLDEAKVLVDWRNQVSHDVWIPPDVFGPQVEMKRLSQRDQKTRPAPKAELSRLRACRERIIDVFYNKGLFLIDLA